MTKIPLERPSRPSEKDYIPEPYRKVAKDIERQFLEFMLMQMKKTIPSENPVDPTINYYQELLTNKRAQIMASHQGGLGIQEMILNQIYPQEKRNKKNYEAYLKGERLKGVTQ